MALWEMTETILPKLVMTRRFTPMRSDMGQGGDCCWAIATAVYSRTSDRSGMRRLWYSLIFNCDKSFSPLGVPTVIIGPWLGL